MGKDELIHCLEDKQRQADDTLCNMYLNGSSDYQIGRQQGIVDTLGVALVYLEKIS